MYSALARKVGVPPALLRAVQLTPHALVRWEPEFGDVDLTDRRFSISSGNEEQIPHETTDTLPLTVAEAVSAWLTREAQRTKRAKGAAVRYGKAVSKALLSWVAFDLLQAHKASPPGPWLKKLLFLQLGLTPPSPKEIARYVAREQAAKLIAANKLIPSATVAARVKVDPSNVSRWRKSKQFQGLVKHYAALAERPKARPTRLIKNPSK
ncbi:hypothetical protein [Bradyrhizobium sp. CCBAU 53380]|uniref:hypothetical protein n=1 Tax=Bradyrhizobium sp. CCBAU 53380 TaxID=1325117 RepID=UPI002304807F|nr:hypothetical protein [Bradyrhizobium sp. CCBAU 53380]